MPIKDMLKLIKDTPKIKIEGDSMPWWGILLIIILIGWIIYTS